MKIALLTPSNIAGGAERVLTSLANEFASVGIETYFIAFDKSTNFYKINEDVHKIYLGVEASGLKGLRKYMLFPLYYRKLKNEIKRIEPDVVISFLFITNIIGTMCCKKLCIPIILSERNDPAKYSAVQKKIMGLIYPKADGFVCQSNVIKIWVEKVYGIKNATVIVNPLNKDQVGELKANKSKEIIAVGRLIPQKNYKLLISAFADIVDEFSAYKLTIFGEGPLREELENQIRYCGLEGKAHLPGIKKDALKIHNDAELFVLSSKYEGYPNVLAEAMANGIICIASDVASGTVRQIISHGQNGYLYPVDDIEALKECIKEALNSDKKIDIIKKARNIYKETSIDGIAKEWQKYSEDVISHRKIVCLAGDKE